MLCLDMKVTQAVFIVLLTVGLIIYVSISNFDHPMKELVSRDLKKELVSRELKKELVSTELQKELVSKEPQKELRSGELQKGLVSGEPQKELISRELQKELTSRELKKKLLSREPQKKGLTRCIEGVKGTKCFKPNEASYIAINLMGGLGNQMFMYTALYAMSKKTYRFPYACIDYNMTVLFPNLTLPLYKKQNCKELWASQQNETLKVKQANGAQYYDPELYQKIIATNKKHVILCCYLQNLGFFLEYLDDMRQEFSLDYGYRQKAYDYLNSQIDAYQNRLQKNMSISIPAQDIQVVGVHIRRGIAHKRGLNAPTPTYFKQAMDYFRDKYKTVLFIVSSDDPKWCHDNLEIGPDVVVTADSGEKSREDDFSIQACCNHTIISFGTFGWWMGFLTKGEVIAFKDWAGKSYAGEHYSPRQKFPTDWILL